jgi:UDP-N-acetylglucosamine 2-epimerase
MTRASVADRVREGTLCVLSVFGTRPEAIKMAPVLRALDLRADVQSIVCVTGQHREMLDQVLTLFDISPDIDLNLMQADQGAGDFAARSLAAVNRVLDEVEPDVLIVQGDTTTAAMAALAAFYRRIPVAHVEAGLRTYDPERPFPEEINRRVIDLVAAYRFAPTRTSARALIREGVPRRSIRVTGNTVVDALHHILRTNRTGTPALDQAGRLVVVTSHRREHFGEPLQRICHAIRAIVERWKDVHVIYPVHLNPNVRQCVNEMLPGHERISLVAPMAYDAFVALMAQASLLVTDSGGIQEEGPALGVPVVIIRDKTERGEAVEAGAAILAGTSIEGILAAVSTILDQPRPSSIKNPFGDGRAAERIVLRLVKEERRRRQPGATPEDQRSAPLAEWSVRGAVGTSADASGDSHAR